MSGRRDGGSALMLVPAGLLVLFLLGALCVDAAVVFLAERDLANRTAAAANDIAAAGLSDAAFYRAGGIALDPDRAAGYVDVAFAPANMPANYRTWSAGSATSGRSVEVTASAEVRHIFAPAIPGLRRTTTVSARSVATAVDG